MSDEIPIHPLIQRMADRIPDPNPGDDKANINSYIFDLELNDDEPGVGIRKRYALDCFGSMARRYDANLLIICGVIPHIKKALYNKNDHIVTAAARACCYIAQFGGAQTLLNDGFSTIFMSIASDQTRDYYVRDMCTRAFGWLHVIREIESKN